MSQTKNVSPLAPAKLSWQDGHAFNLEYQDPYFSREDGLQESEYVFLKHNQLSHRFKQAQNFCVGELGFGTGLNFLLSWRLWDLCAPSDSRLDYIAVEASPLSRDQLQQSLSAWPELQPYRDRLIAALPPPQTGLHCVQLSPRLRLFLLYRDVEEALPQLDARIEAWFLDGFAPAKNPAMWSEKTLAAVAALSSARASFATYTAAGAVRRRLQELGFAVEKCPGFGSKREMLCGQLNAAPQKKPWLAWPTYETGDVAILGDGISGACLARQLAEWQIPVTVISAGQACSQRIPAFLVRNYPERQASRSHRLYQQAFLEAHAFYGAFAKAAYAPCELKGTNGSAQPAGVLYGPEACAQLLNHPLITKINGSIQAINRRADAWELDLRGHARRLKFSRLALCTGNLPAGIESRLSLKLPLNACAGQAAVLNQKLTQAFADNIHAMPYKNASQLGSSYRPGEADLSVRPAESEDLLTQAQVLEPALAKATILSHHTGLRTSSLDHLPVVGPAPDMCKLPAAFRQRQSQRNPDLKPAAPCLPGLWLNLAHGSRGASCAPLAARLLASGICGRILGLDTDLLDAIHPARFATRALKRGETPS